jgi:plasmid stability protein
MEPKQKQPRSLKMATVNLSIKRVPERLVAQLRRRAAAHHRSLQGELLNLLEEAVHPKRVAFSAVRAELLRLGLNTPDEATAIIRKERDAR